MAGADQDRGRPQLGEFAHEPRDPNRLDPAVEPSADDWAAAEAATLAGGRSTVSATPIGEEQARRELFRALSGTPFPADRRRLLADAQRAGVAEPRSTDLVMRW
jgi:hypothetical protein